jgi:hypothetical protein
LVAAVPSWMEQMDGRWPKSKKGAMVMANKDKKKGDKKKKKDGKKKKKDKKKK